MNAAKFIELNTLDKAKDVVNNAPEWADKYDASTGEYHRPVKQLSYMINHVGINELRVEIKEVELGRKLSFKERQALKIKVAKNES